MRKVFGILVIMVVAGIMTAGCVQPRGNETPAPVTETPPLPSIGAQTISITGSGFDPDALIVPVDTTVTWVNNAATNQTIQITGPTGSIDLGVVEPGAPVSYTFTTAGNYAYRSEETGFQGTITVVPDTPSFSPTGMPG